MFFSPCLCASHFRIMYWKKILNSLPQQVDTNIKDILLRNPHHLIEIVTEKTIFKWSTYQLLYLFHHDENELLMPLFILNTSTSFNMWNATFNNTECGFLCFINMYHIAVKNEPNFGKIVPCCLSSKLADVAWYFPEDAVLWYDGWRKDKEKIFLKSRSRKISPQVWRSLLSFFHLFDPDCSFFNSTFFPSSRGQLCPVAFQPRRSRSELSAL